MSMSDSREVINHWAAEADWDDDSCCKLLADFVDSIGQRSALEDFLRAQYAQEQAEICLDGEEE